MSNQQEQIIVQEDEHNEIPEMDVEVRYCD